ncbi:hypothetical protein PFISCL1PPCAC_2664, partial [Pristionchus fissidentatus]
EVFTDPQNIIRTHAVREPAVVRTRIDEDYSPKPPYPFREEEIGNFADPLLQSHASAAIDQSPRQIHLKERVPEYVSTMHSLPHQHSILNVETSQDSLVGTRIVQSRHPRYEDDPIYDPPERSFLSSSASASFLDGVSPVRSRQLEQRSAPFEVRRESITTENEEFAPASEFLPGK